MHCLWHAAANDYVLPDEESGEIKTMPGSKFSKLGGWLRIRGHGGIYAVYRAAGLMFENKDNPVAVRAACDRLAKTGDHSLILGDPEQARWTLDRIIVAGLLHARRHPQTRLPSRTSGSIHGYPGQIWMSCHDSLRNRKNLWLDDKPCTGIVHIFRHFGLKDANKRDIPERIAEGLANIDRTGHHGLKPVVQPDTPNTIPVPRPARERAGLQVE